MKAGSDERHQVTPGARLRSGGAWALGDQAVVSLGSCLTGIILAGTLSLHEFGAFVLISGVLLFLNSLHASLVTFPLSVRGAASDRDDLRRLAGYSLTFTAALFLPLGLALATIAAIADRVSLIPWAVAAMFVWQIHETLRRAMMAHLRHRDAVLGDGLRYVGQVATIWLLAGRGALTLETALTTIAATSFVAVLLQVWQLRPAVPRSGRAAALLRDHWVLGRWVLLGNLSAVITIQAVPWTLAYFHGNAAVARFGLLAQIMGVTNLVAIGLTGVIVPAVAGASRHGIGAARRVAVTSGLQGAALLLPYYAAAVLLPEVFLRVFSKNNPAYADLGWHLRLFVLTYLVAFPGQVMQALLNGLGWTRAAFTAQGAFSVATMLTSVPLAAVFGLTGAVWASALPPLVYVVASASMLQKGEARGVAPVAGVAAAAPGPTAPDGATA